MIKICVNNIAYEDCMTIGKKYDVMVNVFKGTMLYKFKDDNGEFLQSAINRFKDDESILRKPLSFDEVKQRANDNTLETIIPLSFNFIIENNMKNTLDEIAKCVIDDIGFNNIEREFLGFEDNGDTILLKVTGSVEDYLNKNSEV